MTRDIYATFDSFYQRHAVKLFRKLSTGYWVLHPECGRQYRPGVGIALAEEICQQVWTEMWKRLIDGDDLSLPLVYLRADARLTDHFRHVRRFRQLGETDLLASTGISKDEVLDIQRFLSGLPQRDRAALTDWLHGYTTNEIVQRNGIHGNTLTNILRGIKTMNAEEDNNAKKKTRDRVISALPGTPAQIAKKTGISRETVKKQLQRLLKAGKVANDARTYSLALAPIDTSELVGSLKDLLHKLDRKEIRIAPYRFDATAVAEHEMSTKELPELPTEEPRRPPSLDSYAAG